jgi:hypothetical protein
MVTDKAWVIVIEVVLLFTIDTTSPALNTPAGTVTPLLV